jgi:hypothetical protein
MSKTTFAALMSYSFTNLSKARDRSISQTMAGGSMEHDGMICPVCKGNCLREAEEVIADVETRYLSCRRCPPEPNLGKNISGRLLPQRMKRCPSCGRASLDAVMLDALRLLQGLGLRDKDDGLRSVGMPLIDVGYPLAYPPRLGRNSLILVGEKYSKAAAEAMVEEIAEIKGVIESRGVPGVMAPEKKPLKNLLLAGCDMRADVVSSLMGELLVYKRQSLIHIEFSRQNAPKMKILEELYFRSKLRDVVDGLCGPGTLGLMCVLAGAESVVFNDAWLPAIEDLLTNLEVNRKLLGIEEIEYMETPTEMVGREPVLVARAGGACRIEVYHGDLSRLFTRARPSDLCLIDHFPGSDTKALKQACRSCKETIIV